MQNHLQIKTMIDENLLNITLQPLVENAIKHGISNLLDNGKVEIRIFRNKGYLQIINSIYKHNRRSYARKHKNC